MRASCFCRRSGDCQFLQQGRETSAPIRCHFLSRLARDDESWIYKDDKLLYKLEPDSWIYGLASMPDGSIYACGSVMSEPVLWKDGKRVGLNIDGAGESRLFNMVVRGNDWLCCGAIFDDNGTLIDIEEKSSIRNLTFFGGYLVLGGSHENITRPDSESIEFHNSAVQWVSGTPQDFSYGCTGNSELTLLRNWNGLFLFQCVGHEGGVQLCNNGGLILAIPFTQTPYVMCWDIVVK